MNALAILLKRIFSSRNPAGASGSTRTDVDETIRSLRWHEQFLECIEAAQRAAPTTFVIVLNIFR
jgi:hypothetical protein